MSFNTCNAAFSRWELGTTCISTSPLPSN
jgi:hypothetical protein